MNTTDEARDLFVTGLKNAHAMEKQAIAIMEPQVNRLVHYPEILERLELHIEETERQVDRLDEILRMLDESASGMKDTFLSTFGSMAALGHATAGDEVLKNAFANHAFENYEIAAYTGLLTGARLCGLEKALPLLQESLAEERRMAAFVVESIPMTMERYLALRESGESGKV